MTDYALKECPVCSSGEGEELELISGEIGWECFECEAGYRVVDLRVGTYMSREEIRKRKDG